MAKRFPNLIEVFEAPANIEQTDFEDAVYRATARGIAYESVRDTDGENIGRLGRVFLHDEATVTELRRIASLYHTMRDALQGQWEAALKRATVVDEDGVESADDYANRLLSKVTLP